MLAYLALAFAAIIVTGTAAAWIHDVLAVRLNLPSTVPPAQRSSRYAAALRGRAHPRHGHGAQATAVAERHVCDAPRHVASTARAMRDSDVTRAATMPISPAASMERPQVRVRRTVRRAETTAARGRYLPPLARSILPGTVRVRGT